MNNETHRSTTEHIVFVTFVGFVTPCECIIQDEISHRPFNFKHREIEISPKFPDTIQITICYSKNIGCVKLIVSG